MSLNFNLKPITEREGRAYVWTDEGTMRGTTECLIFATMFIGMNRITEANWPTFAARIAAWEKGLGPINTNGETIDADTVRRHIGLSTNASELTLAKFERNLGRKVLDEAKRATERAAKITAS